MIIPKNWTFKNKDVANSFDSHVREQLPWYDLCTEAIEHIARQYLSENGLIYDLGCATGNINKALNELILERKAQYIGIDNSKEMIANFKGNGKVELANINEFEYQYFDVGICFLTMMFLPFYEHEAFLNKIVSKIKKGGCLIVVEKCEPKGGYVSLVLSRLTLREKLKSSTADDIIKKELSLGGVQRPIRDSLFYAYGAEFFRFGDFAGWIIENK